MIFSCCNERRKAAVRENPSLNGIDFLEVLDQDAIALGSPQQRTLVIRCLKPAPAGLVPQNVLIQGGESIIGITADWIAPASALPPAPATNAQEQSYFSNLVSAAETLVIRVDKAGDFSTYTLRLVNDADQAGEDPFQVTEALAGFDPQLTSVDFSFKVECGPDFDCAPLPPNCPPNLPSPPQINYLAKDYGSFRMVMLDRMKQLLPGWAPSSEADFGVALAELISYVGDRLSYQQDAIATEAYIETARSRISMRRHARLVDYEVQDGSSARAWVRLEVSEQVFLDRKKTRFYTDVPNLPSDLSPGSGNEEAALLAGTKVFEPMQDAMLFPEHNQMSFYTWGDSNCCLPRGATEATLLGTYPDLQPGDVLIFQEMVGPQTGQSADADIRRRWAVRLTQVTTRDALGNALVDPLFESQTGLPITDPSTQDPAPVTEIQWSSSDALPFPVCISSEFIDSDDRHQAVTGVSLAFGNVVLADHGVTFSGIALGTVPEPTLFVPQNMAADRCSPMALAPLPVRFRPRVPDSPVTQATPLALTGSPVTPDVVMLNGATSVSLSDVNEAPCLLIRADDPFAWPQFFGVIVSANSINPADIDLSVVYSPLGGGHGVPTPIVIERFESLSFTPADPNYVAKQVNALSKLVQVPASYVPPASPPAGYSPSVTNLPVSGPIALTDTASVAYLTVQPTNPATWPSQFGVLAQGSQQDDASFTMLVVFQPASGGIGVSLPVIIESFVDVSLATVADQFDANSDLITVQSFEGAPAPGLSATDLMHPNVQSAVPIIELTGSLAGLAFPWAAARTLLASDESDRAFVVEVEADGVATLRFGDGVNGLRPDSGTVFTASYRVGNGADGNVGPESLIHLATDDARIQTCTNPMPAMGGSDPETNDQIRRRAPQAFLTQERAVTMADYENIVERNAGIDESVATLRWTGSWYTVFIAAEPVGGGSLSPALSTAIQRDVERYRLAGQDLQMESPEYVSLEIELTVCVDPSYFRSDVEKGLLQVLGTGIQPNGQRGFFYPDNFTFGQSIYLSPIYQAARSVPGILTVTATKFQRQGVDTDEYLSLGELRLGSFQIARLANDRSLPDHGRLTFVILGGK